MVGRNESCTNVVDAAVIRFADKGVDAFDRFIAGLLERPGEKSVNPGGDTERVGENNRRFKRAEFVDLRNSRGLAKAVSDKYAGGHFFLKNIAAVREEFLPRYYLDDEQIPKIIAVDELPPDSDALQQALNEKRGSEVQLYVPQRGDKAHLVEMAHTNAVERLARESGRYAREEKLLDELAQVLGLAKPPRAIESYDISNWGDGSSVCGMVTFKDGKPYKAGYRKFKMKTVAGTDDYASLAETVSRRAAEYEKYAELAKKGEPCSNWFGQKPDLLLMDGGRGQVSAAKEALAGTALADVPLYGMVKDDHHRTRTIVDSDGREIAINMNRGTFTFITAIQDETHRFANAYRKQQMKQKSYSSTLTEIPGIGPKTAKALMAQFKSVTAVKEATPDQLENTPGVGKQTAQIIYAYFHE
mgnify:CR=1 FL=1